MVVGTLRDHLQNIFRTYDRHQPGLGVAVDGGEEHMTTRFDQVSAGAHHRSRIGNVLQHFHAGHDVVFLWVGLGVALYRFLHVIHIHAGFQRV
ncbi:hypothetical protein D3C78_1316950 [compost metagenome]